MSEIWKMVRAAVLSAVGLVTMSAVTIANLASPHPVDVKQPDGSEITLYMRGTEHLNWYEYVPEIRAVNRNVLDTPAGIPIGRTPGFTVVKDANGQYVFAQRDANGDWAPSDTVVGRDQPPQGTPRRLLPDLARAEARADAQMPGMHDVPPKRVSAAGDVSNLVILMRFSDHKMRTLPSAADFDVIFNRQGGDPTLAPTGSVFDVYNENSYGQMRLRSTIVGWVDLPKTEAQYAAGESGLTTAIHGAIKDALDKVVAGNLANFADFDNENGGVGDGRIDAITFVHSGFAAEFGGVDEAGVDHKNRIWSHRWSIPQWSANPAGVKVSDYNINPGLWGLSGTAPGRIGVICHEIGHFFGLPDLYDYSGQGEGAGSWCLMANSWGFDGSQYHPPHFSAWSKIFLGWNSPVILSTPGKYDVTATSVVGANIYRINYPGGAPGEYLLIENRQPIGNFEGGIPAGSDGLRGGLAVWHIDDAKPENDDPGFPGQTGWPSNGKHYRVGLLQADGEYGLERGFNRGDGNDVFRAGFKYSLTSATVPTSSSYSGLAVPDISGITSTAQTMSFVFGQPTDGGDGGGELVAGCCPVTANAVVRFGTTADKNTALTSVTITLEEDSIVHLTANGSVSSDQSVPITITNGFFNQDIPADPAQDEMWFPTLRFVTVPNSAWTNFGSTGALALPKGTHTIFWKVWVTAAKLEFDSGTLLIEAFPAKSPTPGLGPMKTGASPSEATRASSRQGAAAGGAPAARGTLSLCCSDAFAALITVIGKTDDQADIRKTAIKTAADLARFDKAGCETLGKALSAVVTNTEDSPEVRHAAIEAMSSLVVP